MYDNAVLPKKTVSKMTALAEKRVGSIWLFRKNNFTKRANDKDAWCTFAQKKT